MNIVLKAGKLREVKLWMLNDGVDMDSMLYETKYANLDEKTREVHEYPSFTPSVGGSSSMVLVAPIITPGLPLEPTYLLIIFMLNRGLEVKPFFFPDRLMVEVSARKLTE
jgi:hypothetical protein